MYWRKNHWENMERCFYIFIYFCSLNSRKNKGNNFLLLSENGDLKEPREHPLPKCVFCIFLFSKTKNSYQKHQPSRPLFYFIYVLNRLTLVNKIN